MTDVDVAQDGQSKGQPYGCCVEHLRVGLKEELEHEAWERGPGYSCMSSKCVDIDIPKNEIEIGIYPYSLISYQGAGGTIVRRSHTAIDINMVLVGVFIIGLG